MTPKTQLLLTLRSHRAEWDGILASIRKERMTQSGAAGHWSVKDIISHISVYEYWLVEWLVAASLHSFPAPSLLDEPDIERRNAKVYDMTHRLSLQQVTDEASRTFEALLIVIGELPDEYFTDPKTVEWFMKPYWSKMKTVPEAVLNLSVDHYTEHIPAIKKWIEMENG